MTLSALQKYIMLQSYGKEKRINRDIFLRYYTNRSSRDENIVKIISKSLERLIEKGLMTGYGERTKEKWFIREVQLTALGRRVAKKLIGVQARLPFTRNTKSKTLNPKQI
jgi:hypothetical protein